MKKLRLELDQLAVESFTTSDPVMRRGTVEAHNDTWVGNTCGPERTCGPQTCGQLYCVIGTDPINCPAPSGAFTCAAGCTVGTGPTGGQLSCAGCTTQNYTADLGDDTCGFCQSFGSDAPQRCPCP